MWTSYTYWLKTTALVTVIGAASVALPQAAFAQDGQASAEQGEELSEEQLNELVEAFEASPELFLEDATEEQLAAVLAADPGKIDTVIAIVETTNPEAAGLVGRAAALAVSSLEESGEAGAASDIQTAIATSTSGEVASSFNEASDQVAAAAGDEGQDDGAPLTALPDDGPPDDGGDLGGTPPAGDGAGDGGGADGDDAGGGAGASGGGGGIATGGGGGDDDDDDDGVFSPG
jgi:hypothetical protein